MFSLKVIDRQYAAIRKKFSIPHDGLRHTFISAFATLHGQDKAATEAGNTVDIIRKHYFNLMSEADAAAFWEIFPS
jgi:tetrahydromethanopterin S-methyltransferase subunit H